MGQQAEAGWYPDAADANAQRWRDGGNWAESAAQWLDAEAPRGAAPRTVGPNRISWSTQTTRGGEFER